MKIKRHPDGTPAWDIVWIDGWPLFGHGFFTPTSPVIKWWSFGLFVVRRWLLVDEVLERMKKIRGEKGSDGSGRS